MKDVGLQSDAELRFNRKDLIEAIKCAAELAQGYDERSPKRRKLSQYLDEQHDVLREMRHRGLDTTKLPQTRSNPGKSFTINVEPHPGDPSLGWVASSMVFGEGEDGEYEDSDVETLAGDDEIDLLVEAIRTAVYWVNNRGSGSTATVELNGGEVLYFTSSSKGRLTWSKSAPARIKKAIKLSAHGMR